MGESANLMIKVAGFGGSFVKGKPAWMKVEDRVIELLVKCLEKIDRLLDRMEKTDKQIERTHLQTGAS